MKKNLLSGLLTALFSTFLILFHTSAWAQKSPYDWALIQLDYIRQEKVDHLKRFTRRLHDLAQKASDDQRVVAFFEMNRHYHHASINDTPPASLTDKVEEMRQDFSQYYIFNYFSFYDILFVDTQGIVFYSIRKEKDTYLNLVNEKEFAGVLGEVIAQKPEQEIFIDFLKAKNGEPLETWGVSTCTALIATVPGRFSYLAHISPLDKIYNGSGTNIVEQITKKIKNFDIYPYEMQDVVFVAAAPHLDSISNIIDQLIEEGFFLSQIKMAYHPSASSVAVYSDYQKDRLIFEWILKTDTYSKYISDMEQTVNIGDIIEEIMQHGKEG